jgi:hypothetical protein
VVGLGRHRFCAERCDELVRAVRGVVDADQVHAEFDRLDGFDGGEEDGAAAAERGLGDSCSSVAVRRSLRVR